MGGVPRIVGPRLRLSQRDGSRPHADGRDRVSAAGAANRRCRRRHLLGLTEHWVTWNLGLGPRWYPFLLVALAIAQCWAGGRLYEMQSGVR